MKTDTVLIVEDEAVVAEDIKESLEEFGFQVLGPAATGEDAVSLALSESPSIILMDIKLAGEMDGIDAAEKIQSEINIPVVYLTAYSDQSTLDRAKVTQPYGYLLKPYKEVDLRTTLELALYKHSTEGAPEGQSSIGEDLEVKTEKGSEHFEKIVDTLFRIDHLSAISEEEIDSLAEFCVLKKYTAGDLVTLEGDEMPSGFVVTSGRIAVLKSSANGKELIVELLPAGDTFGLLCSLQKQPHPYTTRAQAETELVWIPRQKLLNALEKYPAVSKNFIEETFARLRSSHDISRSLAHDRVEVRVAAALRALAPKFSRLKESEDNTVITMTRQELADLVGTTQETCIRVTRSMEDEGILDLSKNGAIRICSAEKLQSLAG